jgi:hypothetical protein
MYPVWDRVQTTGWKGGAVVLLLTDPAARPVVVGLALFCLAAIGIWAIVDRWLIRLDKNDRDYIAIELKRAREEMKNGRKD